MKNFVQIAFFKKFQVFLLLLSVFMLGSCGTLFHPPARGRTVTRVLERKTLKGIPPAPLKGRFVQEGIASWYGPNFNKKRTANGEVYDMYGMTAAHQSIPFNIYVKVTNLENGKSVVVRINDRGPFAKNRIIDLTYTAASRLGMLEKGTARVRIEGLGFIRNVEGKRVYVEPTTYAIAGSLTLQVGSFESKVNAEGLARQLRTDFAGVHITEIKAGAGKFYRVLVGKYRKPEKAIEDLNRLIQAGFTKTHLLTE